MKKYIVICIASLFFLIQPLNCAQTSLKNHETETDQQNIINSTLFTQFMVILGYFSKILLHRHDTEKVKQYVEHLIDDVVVTARIATRNPSGKNNKAILTMIDGLLKITYQICCSNEIQSLKVKTITLNDNQLLT